MDTLFQQKSMLAKLLAQENINVEHRKVSTAYFDLKSRTMVLPFWKVMDGVVYDLLVGHEVGHAEFTPEQGWHDAVVSNRALKDYLNVIEDARIERKIKDKYPGLRRSFNDAYKKLYDEDFFALKDRDVSKLNIIDRINVFYKLGAHVKVAFTTEELVFIDRINAADSWEAVEAIANDVFAYAKAQKDQKPQTTQPQPDEDDDSEGEGDDGEDMDDMDMDSSDDFGDEDDSESDESGDSDDEEKQSGKSASQSQEQDDQDIASETDRAFRKNESKLVDTSSGDIHIWNVPTYKSNFLVGHKQVHAKISEKIDEMVRSFPNLKARNAGLYADLIKRTSSVVNYMIKEFEMRKNASQLARGKVAKSGKIDPKRLARFSMDQDIFKRITTVPQGKNHGLVMFIDLSGSMTSIIEKTYEQAIVMTQFCRKAGIPFEVYGFSDNMPARGFDSTKDHCKLEVGDAWIYHSHFHIKQYLSSTMKGSTYRDAVMNMLYVGGVHGHTYSRYTPAGYVDMIPESEKLNGTPLNEAIVASIDLVGNFKTQYKLDIVNTIFLTDGMGGGVDAYKSVPKVDEMGNSYGDGTAWVSRDDTVYFQDKKSKLRVRRENLTNQGHDDFASTRALIELAKKITGSKYTGYMINHNKREIANTNFNYEYSYVNRMVQSDQITAFNKKVVADGFYSSKKFGFDEYFFVLQENLRINDQQIAVDSSATKNAIAKAFSKSLNKRGLQRMFLNKFVQNLAA